MQVAQLDTTEITDQAAIEAVLAGNRQAFRLLVERYSGVTLSYAARLVEHHQEAEDICQESFVAAYRFLPRFDARTASFVTWLLTIVRNRCLDSLDRTHRKNLHSVGLHVVAGTPSEPAVQAGVCGVELSEFEMNLKRALTSLPVDQRSAFVLAEVEGLSLTEVARIEGVPLGTVKSRIARAREKLQATLSVFRPVRGAK